MILKALEHFYQRLRIKNFTNKARFYVIYISFLIFGKLRIMLVGSSKTKTRVSKCQLCLSIELDTNYSSENTFGLVVVVFFFQIHLRN